MKLIYIKDRLINYLYVVGVLTNYLLLIFFLLSIIAALVIFNRYDLPAHVFFDRAEKSLSQSSSPLLQKSSEVLALINESVFEEPNHEDNSSPKVIYDHNFTGANTENSQIQEQSDLEENVKLVSHHHRLKSFDKSRTRVIEVNNSNDLLKAIKSAEPGDDIIISKGKYQLKSRQIYFKQHGLPLLPIRIRAKKYGEVTLELETLEGFVMLGDYWIIENLKINGICKLDQQCEHAIHIVGASHLIIRNNQLTNFNSIVKANASGSSIDSHFPDDILFEHNSLFNDTSRKTDTSVTLLDVVTGSNWIVRKNFIANHSKRGSDNTSYALFLKGNGENGLIDSNIIDCEWKLPDDGNIRVGISLGGGGTGQAYCRNGSCMNEHSNGVISNNLVLNCSQDVGIYLNKAANTQIIHNTLINTLGIDVRFKTSAANIINNVMTSTMRTRDGASIKQSNNVTNYSVLDEDESSSVLSKTEKDLCGFNRYKFSLAGAMTSECKQKLNLTLF